MKNRFLYFILFYICSLASSFASPKYIAFDNLDFMKEPNQKIARVVEELEKHSGEVVAFALNNSAMTSDNFNKLTQSLNLKKILHLKVLDISDNKLDENSASDLACWLRLESKPYIKITGTPIALKNVFKLSKEFGRLFPEEAPNFMEKIIFMSRDYINKAHNRIKIYATLVSKEKIPTNWAKIHWNFYDLKEYKGLLEQKEFNRYQSTMVNMQRLSISPRIYTTLQEQDLYDEIDEQETLIDFNEALESISPNPTPTRH